ncbi:hypothetical protein FIV42_16430 [Persicimonas caeni]|uniref:Uncharacterized protein n=1 Tax=Persicimonas caeni TaxID=2292766 RepID=A0A4Y6PVB4_PERCE|nr:hypothetical protein [Persicimonas caeni]QDG52266.1 hypothetical protein FIV42_16430 [Persicimonas caeni]QED33488.1 hypothetical protein FRD00_16425 [Persicimonas caeni]
MAQQKNDAATSGGLTRPRYFPRQVVTAADLMAEQAYFRARMRRQNRLLHGCGVACGLEVFVDKSKYSEAGPVVRITSGYALGPDGEEIWVPEDREVVVDCWSSEPSNCELLHEGALGEFDRVWVAVRWAEAEIADAWSVPGECMSRAERETARMAETYELRLFTEKPTCCEPMSCAEAWKRVNREEPPQSVEDAAACPSCEGEGWVVLAALGQNEAEQIVVDYAPRVTLPAVAPLAKVVECGLAQVSTEITIDAIVPAVGHPMETVEVAIVGQNIGGTRTVTFDDGNIDAYVTDRSNDGWILARLEIGEASQGPKAFVLEGPDFTAQSEDFSVYFDVQAAEVVEPSPQILSIEPDQVVGGFGYPTTIGGIALSGTTAVHFLKPADDPVWDTATTGHTSADWLTGGMSQPLKRMPADVIDTDLQMQVFNSSYDRIVGGLSVAKSAALGERRFVALRGDGSYVASGNVTLEVVFGKAPQDDTYGTYGSYDSGGVLAGRYGKSAGGDLTRADKTWTVDMVDEIGKVRRDILEQSGVYTVTELAFLEADELAGTLGVSESEATKMIDDAKGIMRTKLG